MRSNDRSILITGASSGIGLATATLLNSRGWRVLATARRDADLQHLETMGLEALPLELSRPASIEACAQAALDRTGGQLTALFNNAAYGQPGAVEDLTVEVLKAQFEVNLFAWHDLTRRILPAMRRTGQGRIVQCSSVLGFVAPPYRGAYNASKHALEALSDSLRFELHGSGIHVSIIEPGPIETRFVANAIEMFRLNVPFAGSAHEVEYRRRLAAMEAGGKRRGKLGPEAVALKVAHAVESPRPKVRYRVTTATHLAAVGKRLLPPSLMDVLVRKG
ncbi:MAG: SDR family NAD(P)-dependent oxidoreductase [Hyphomicrobiaceae bacterium]